MYAEMRSLPVLKPKDLDTLLAKGWFRMRQIMFTTHFLCFNNRLYSALWLRCALTDTAEDARFQKLKKKNSAFTFSVGKGEITPQHEALYGEYQQGISFQPTESLQVLLNGYETGTLFNTCIINLYDGSRLIAAGYFDVGANSAAGIVSFYHPQYKKYSLGKYLIYLKMDYCRRMGLQYFYPGYTVPGYPPFDYKLTVATQSMEYYNLAHNAWLPCKKGEMEIPLEEMQQKLTELKKWLQQKGMASSLLYYRYFDAGLDPYFTGYRLLGYPVFLQYAGAVRGGDTVKIVVYEVCSQQYRLLKCSSLSQTDIHDDSPGIFSSDLLVTDRLMQAATTPEEMAQMMVQAPVSKKD